MVKTLSNKKRISITYLVLFILSLIFIFFNINHSNFWFDEGFSLHLIKVSYNEIWAVTADDVHPPLYYWMLKLFSNIFGHTVMIARAFSALPILLCVILGYTHIRKIWNDKVAIFFILLMLLHPAMHYAMYEIRMYSWALFFCLTTYIYAYQFYADLKYKDLALLVFFALCAAYTHYYALITVAVIFGWLFISLCINKRNKLYLFFIATICCIVGYTPWLTNLLGQVSTVTEDYWIENVVSFKDILELVSPFVKMKFVAIILFPLLIGGIVYSSKSSKGNNKYIKQGLILLLIAISPIIIGVSYSALIRPVFIARYIYPSLPLLLLGVAILLSTLNLKNRTVQVVVFLFFGFITFESIRMTKKETKRFREVEARNKQFDEFISETIDQKSIFLYHYASHAEMPYWTLKYPNNKHIAKEIKIVPRNQVVEFVPHQRIASFADLTEDNTSIFYECNDGDKTGFGGSTKDSTDLVAKYDIVRKIHSSDHTLYELIRKPNIID